MKKFRYHTGHEGFILIMMLIFSACISLIIEQSYKSLETEKRLLNSINLQQKLFSQAQLGLDRGAAGKFFCEKNICVKVNPLQGQANAQIITAVAAENGMIITLQARYSHHKRIAWHQI